MGVHAECNYNIGTKYEATSQALVLYLQPGSKANPVSFKAMCKQFKAKVIVAAQSVEEQSYA